jgi:muconolactone D-isomerase
MEFLVKFELDIPNNVPDSEIKERERAESVEADALADQGRLVRLWKAYSGNGPTTILGLYRADSEAELNEILGVLPLYEWMRTSITPLDQHPNDPGEAERPLNESVVVRARRMAMNRRTG